MAVFVRETRIIAADLIAARKHFITFTSSCRFSRPKEKVIYVIVTLLSSGMLHCSLQHREQSFLPLKDKRSCWKMAGYWKQHKVLSRLKSWPIPFARIVFLSITGNLEFCEKKRHGKNIKFHIVGVWKEKTASVWDLWNVESKRFAWWQLQIRLKNLRSLRINNEKQNIFLFLFWLLNFFHIFTCCF